MGNTTPDRPRRRRSPRCPWIDYGARSAFFVTFVTARRACLFGRVEGGVVRFSPFGTFAEAASRRLGHALPWARIAAHVVMPNHVHAVVVLTDPGPGRTLHRVVAAWKAMTTAAVRRHTGNDGAVVWQRSYHDHEIRSVEEWNAIDAYIAANPARWERDPLNATRRDDADRPPVGGNAV